MPDKYIFDERVIHQRTFPEVGISCLHSQNSSGSNGRIAKC